MRAVLILAGAALVLSGCGRMGELESPHRETERAPRSARSPGLPEPATINRPNREVPVEGGPGSTPYDGPGNRPG